MKLRIHNNFIRLRLSQTEVKNLEEKGRISHSIAIGPKSLQYSIYVDSSIEDLNAKMLGDEIVLTAPETLCTQWYKDEEVSMENKDQSELRLLIEKDFQCLHKRSGEDETDNFPNPLAEKR